MVDQKFWYASTLGQDHLSQRWRNFTFMGPHNNFFRKKIRYSKSRDTLTYVYLYFLVTPHEAPDHSQSYIQKGGISGDQAPLHQLILIFAPKNAGNVVTITQVYIVSGTFTVILCLAMLPSSLISLLKSPFVHHNNIVIRIILRRRCCFYVIVVVIVIITVNFILIIIFLTA